MISSDFINNLKYYGKFFIIIIIIFILLKFVVSLKIYESVLLALIIGVSILIIENLIYVNNIASDPLNCDQCKISTVETNEKILNNNDDNIVSINLENVVPNPFSESESETKVKVKEI